MISDDLTVFLVDDDQGIRSVLVEALKQRGISVKAFDSAEAFLDGYDIHQSGCLVLDLSMPNMNGLELQMELSNRGLSIPIIFITGDGDVPRTVQALKAGAFEFLEKPFKHEVLIQRIHEAFDKDQKMRAASKKFNSIHSRFERLTDRELQVMRLFISGSINLSNKDVARELDISHRTVEHHRERIMQKTLASSIAELAQMAYLVGFDCPVPE